MARRCTLCDNNELESFVLDRLRQNMSFETIASKLSSKALKADLGHKRAPSAKQLADHVVRHRAIVPLEAASESGQNGAVVEAGPYGPADVSSGDVATSMQQKGLELLGEGKLKLSANNVLRAQEILDKRAERQANRELALLMSRILAQQSEPPADLVVEGEVVDVTPG